MSFLNDAHVRMILADDHALIRAGLCILLEQIEGVEVVAEAGDGDALIRLAEELEPEIVFTDIAMPGTDGLAAIRHLARTRPRMRCVAVSMHDTADMVRRAAQAGAAGYLLKNASSEELERAIGGVLTRGAYFSPGVVPLLLAPVPPGPGDLLTERQLEILKRVARGWTSKEIGHALNLSHKTVDAHRARIMDRLQLHDISALTRYALANGLFSG
jgi:DNA-binding NarL/FixJ family response regulator